MLLLKNKHGTPNNIDEYVSFLLTDLGLPQTRENQEIVYQGLREWIANRLAPYSLESSDKSKVVCDVFVTLVEPFNGGNHGKRGNSK